MVPTTLILAIACVGAADPADSKKVVAAIRTAYEANRAALAPTGTIVFHITDGVVGPSPTLERFDADLRARWERHSPSAGIYVFDGAYRRYDNIYSREDLLARRTVLSVTSWTSVISGIRLLTDGETTLVDHVDASLDGKSMIHSGNLRAGVVEFFRSALGVPLSLGNPDPSDRDLGRCLESFLTGCGGATLVELDERANLDGRAVVKLELDMPVGPVKRRITFWVDLERGAIPLQMRLVASAPQASDTDIYQVNHQDLRPVERGWLPFRTTLAEGDVTPGGGVKKMFVREAVIESANFTDRPPRTLFSLMFPEEQGLSDSDRRLGFGIRRVWDVSDFSPSARARAMSLRAVGHPTGPALSFSSWLTVILVLYVTLLVIASALITIRRLRQDKPSV